MLMFSFLLLLKKSYVLGFDSFFGGWGWERRLKIFWFRSFGTARNMICEICQRKKTFTGTVTSEAASGLISERTGCTCRPSFLKNKYKAFLKSAEIPIARINLKFFLRDNMQLLTPTFLRYF